ncbi:hypothetical protein A7X81_04845 [Campylobacter ornithocola]|uniref:Uncharacterized protein n=1 Tax=Campylobacter ornithocola TaxID=1848766 RepID=A0A6M8MTM9_9BACT|nr:type II secretion system protein [Campylobacter ornithocola]OCX42410.1 hypothetical protein A7X81_04845 [Campylobacter ornithocola]QKF57762.1 putative type II secretion system protein [Campylobacter ornithocola]
MQTKKAFTLIELVFCMMIIAILSMVAYPYFSFGKNDAKLIQVKSEVELINASLSLLRNQFLFKESNNFPTILDEALIDTENQKLFFCSNLQNRANQCTYSVLEKPIISNKKSWMKIANAQYRFFINTKNYIDFSYNSEKVFLECVSLNCKDYGF